VLLEPDGERSIPILLLPVAADGDQQQRLAAAFLLQTLASS
jgi:hypothetical protein